MNDALVCWKCGASLEALVLPLARLAECPACSADLHVCRMCEFYDTGSSGSCREPVADDVPEKERANFCGYFRPRPGAHDPGNEAEAEAARAQLEALFGDAPEPPGGGGSGGGPTKEELDKLFRGGR